MSPEGKSAADFVAQWLETSGTALELRVARAFRRGSGEVTHARYYVANDEQTLRESDVVAVVRGRITNPSLTLHFVIECKSAPDPWVLYESEEVYLRQDADLLPTFEVRSFGGVDPSTIQRLYAAPVLYTAERHAYQLADTKDGRVAYSAARQVMAGIDGLIGDVPPIDQSAVLISVPVLVTSGPLFKVALDGSGQPHVTPVDRMLLLSRQRTEDQLRSIWVLQESAVEKFVDDAVSSAEAIQIYNRSRVT